MLNKVDLLLLTAKSRWDGLMDRLVHEEKGAADIVAILVVIVILLGVAAMFKGQLEALVQSVFGKATEWVENPT